MKKILVTGGAGYKGVILVRKLLEQGYHVTLLDNFMYGYDPILHLLVFPKLEVIKQDIRNKVETIGKFDVIVHLAGISGYPACEANPHSAQLINVDATKSLVQSLSKNQLFIYASTTSFYGKSGKVCNEDTPVEPVSIYGITKYEAEKIVMQHANAISLRFATVFGISPKMRMDLMVNDFVYKANKERIVILFDSYAKRTFMHVEDVADCYNFAIQHSEKMVGNIYNAGGGNLNFSKLEIAEKIKKFIDFKIVDSEVKDKDVRHFLVSYKKLEKLGFTPQKTVEDGIQELLRMYRFYEYFSFYKTI
jgi:nucleoside-diphosphate-sugar epimerase